MKAILYDWVGLNVWLFHLINGIHGPWIDAFMRLGTRLGDHANFTLYLPMIALFAVYSLRASPDRAALWVEVLGVLSIAYVIDGWLVTWIKLWLDLPRPLTALPAGSVIVVGPPEFRHSLPSGHAAFAMLLAASLWPAMDRPTRLAAAAFVLWVGVSRISVGAHFPADVVAGYLLTLGLVLAIRAFVTRLRTWRQLAGPGP
jgi:membrane-associated phospholipid phosphatase